MSHVRPLALLLALAAPALASDRVPSGFNLESVPGGPTIAGTLLDGTVLLSTGSFGFDELSVVQDGGTITLFADGFGSLAGVAQSPVTGDIVVGDSFPPLLWVLRDLNDDGDALDAGEKVLHPVQPPVVAGPTTSEVPLPFALAFRPGTDELYMTGSTLVDGYGVVTRTFDGTVNIFADDMGYAAGLVFDGEALHVGDVDSSTSVGRVFTLRDANGDGDAFDAGERAKIADGLEGAGSLVQATDGHLYLATGGGGTIARLVPDGDDDGAADDVIADYFTGFVFPLGLVLIEGAGGFAPGAAGEGTLHVSDYFFPGDQRVHAAPLATLAIDGEVANDAKFDVVLGGAPFAAATFLMSLDPLGITVPGIGDLCSGFGAPWVMAPYQTLDAAGTARIEVIFHGLPGLVGEMLVFQGITLQDDRFGISNGITTVVAP